MSGLDYDGGMETGLVRLEKKVRGDGEDAVRVYERFRGLDRAS